MIRPDYNKSMFPHWSQIPIRFRDLDPLNHVNNAIFCTFYEEARVNFINDLSTLKKEMINGFSFVLANIDIDFIQPVEYPANLLIGNGIRKTGNTSITSFQAIYHAQSKELVSVATSSAVWFDLHKKQPAPLPEIENVNRFVIDM